MKKNAKKIAAIIAAVVILVGIIAGAVHSYRNTIKVYVSISVEADTLNVSYACVRAADKDNDGKISIGDVLECTHNKYYKGGSANGYAVYNSPDFDGFSLLKLWGVTNEGGFGYFVNNERAMSLNDEVKENDHVYAFAYTDLENFTDAYAFFDETEKNVSSKEEFKLTLNKRSYDDSWDLIDDIARGVTITIDGEKTQFVTDENGEAVISINQRGKHIVSAVSPEGTVLTAPICIVNVK